MNIIANTDKDWFSYLKKNTDDTSVINFWTPNPWNLKQIRINEKFYFHLKSPVRKIGGYGLFKEKKIMTIEQAWDTYKEMNGHESKFVLTQKIENYLFKNTGRKITEPHKIGCILLSNPTFFESENYKNPETLGTKFEKNVVTFKYIAGINKSKWESK